MEVNRKQFMGRLISGIQYRLELLKGAYNSALVILNTD